MELLAFIRGNEWAATLLAEFDFDIARVENGPVEDIHLDSGDPLEMVAGDASGGAFLLAGTGQSRPVVYAGSEGEGGLIATSLRDALALVVGLSSIHDAVNLPYGDDGGKRLREWLIQTDAEVREDFPDLDTNRVRLREALALPEASTLLEAMHQALADERYRPISDAGDRYESMLRT